MHTIIKDLMSKLNYTFDHLPSSNMLLNTYMELDIFQQMYRKAAKANEKSEGFLADCYFNYVDVGVYGLPREVVRPNWINVVREPISRYVSHFYYMARDWRMQNKVLAPEDAKVSLQSINLKVSTFFLQDVSSGIDIMYLALADRNVQVRFGLQAIWES